MTNPPGHTHDPHTCDRDKSEEENQTQDLGKQAKSCVSDPTPQWVGTYGLYKNSKIDLEQENDTKKSQETNPVT